MSYSKIQFDFGLTTANKRFSEGLSAERQTFLCEVTMTDGQQWTRIRLLGFP